MANDDITLRHLARQRVRGAPKAVLGAAGFVREYAASEVLRKTERSLVVPLSGAISLAKLRDAYAQVLAVARSQNLVISGDPMYVVKADPMLVAPHLREVEVCLPVRGEAREEDGVKLSRLEGGYHIVASTAPGSGSDATGGLADVENLYTWLFGKFLPARKHELTRPYILHRVLWAAGALDAASPGSLPASADLDSEAVGVELQVPATLSIKSARVPGDA